MKLLEEWKSHIEKLEQDRKFTIEEIEDMKKEYKILKEIFKEKNILWHILIDEYQLVNEKLRDSLKKGKDYGSACDTKLTDSDALMLQLSAIERKSKSLGKIITTIMKGLSERNAHIQNLEEKLVQKDKALDDARICFKKASQIDRERKANDKMRNMEMELLKLNMEIKRLSVPHPEESERKVYVFVVVLESNINKMM